MAPTAIGSNWHAVRRRRKGWAAAGPQHQAYRGGAYCVATHTACLGLFCAVY